MIYATCFNQSLNDIHINLLLIIKICEDNRSFAFEMLKFVNGLKKFWDVEIIMYFCNVINKFEYRGRIQFANGTLLVYIFGEKCIEPFNTWLDTWTAKHSTPTAFDKEIGSYVTLIK